MDIMGNQQTTDISIQKTKTYDMRETVNYEDTRGNKTSISFTPGVSGGSYLFGNNTHMVVNNFRDDDNYTNMDMQHGSRKHRKAARPIIEDLSLPKQGHKNIVAEHIGDDWRKLGHELCLSDGRLDALESDNHMEGQYEISYQMIRTWEQVYHPVSVQLLAQCCAAVGRGDIADMLYI